VELDSAGTPGSQAHADQRREMNVEFCQYVESAYESWGAPGSDAGAASPTVPPLGGRRGAVGGAAPPGGEASHARLIDCMRLDQWLTVEPLLRPYFDITLDTRSRFSDRDAYSRNAIFSGLFRRDPEAIPEYWQEISGTNEQEPLRAPTAGELLERLDISIAPGLKYLKVSNVERRATCAGTRTFQNIRSSRWSSTSSTC